MRRIERFHAWPRRLHRLDDRRAIGGLVAVIRNGTVEKDEPRGHGPHATLHYRLVRWSGSGPLSGILLALAPGADGGMPGRPKIDSAQLKAHRTAARPARLGRFPALTGRTSGSAIAAATAAACRPA
ncbi:MAG: hypothetical protein U1E17_18605 [Geminicoccaceae bacterium]